jgi:hypothetical protein
VFGLRADGQEQMAWRRRGSGIRTGDGERCIIAFGVQNNTVMVVIMSGIFCRCRFEPEHGGEMELLERHNFMASSN